MGEPEHPQWWRDLLRKEVLAGHVVNWAVGLIMGLIVTVALVAWAAWRGSFLWTQRLIGAAMMCALLMIVLAIVLAILRRRAVVVKVEQPIGAKGYLDHQVDREKAMATISRMLTEITKITEQETIRIKAGTTRIPQIARLSPVKQLANSRRSARFTDKMTSKLVAKIPPLATATKTYSQAELSYWEWRVAQSNIGHKEARTILGLMKKHLSSIREYMEVLMDGRRATEGRKGESEAVNEAIDRRLAVVDRLYEAVATQQDPLERVIVMLRPFAKEP